MKGSHLSDIFQIAPMATVLALSFALPAFAEVQPLEGEQLEDVYIMSTVTVRPTNDRTATPYYDGELDTNQEGKPTIADIQRLTTSIAVSRDLDDSINQQVFNPPPVPPNFEQRLSSALQQSGYLDANGQLSVTQLPDGSALPASAFANGSGGNYSVGVPAQGLGLTSSPTGLRIVLPNTGNLPDNINGGPNSPVSIQVQGDQVILQLNNLK